MIKEEVFKPIEFFMGNLSDTLVNPYKTYRKNTEGLFTYKVNYIKCSLPSYLTYNSECYLLSFHCISSLNSSKTQDYGANKSELNNYTTLFYSEVKHSSFLISTIQIFFITDMNAVK